MELVRCPLSLYTVNEQNKQIIRKKLSFVDSFQFFQSNIDAQKRTHSARPADFRSHRHRRKHKRHSACSPRRKLSDEHQILLKDLMRRATIDKPPLIFLQFQQPVIANRASSLTLGRNYRKHGASRSVYSRSDRRDRRCSKSKPAHTRTITPFDAMLPHIGRTEHAVLNTLDRVFDDDLEPIPNTDAQGVPLHYSDIPPPPPLPTSESVPPPPPAPGQVPSHPPAPSSVPLPPRNEMESQRTHSRRCSRRGRHTRTMTSIQLPDTSNIDFPPSSPSDGTRSSSDESIHSPSPDSVVNLSNGRTEKCHKTRRSMSRHSHKSHKSHHSHHSQHSVRCITPFEDDIPSPRSRVTHQSQRTASVVPTMDDDGDFDDEDLFCNLFNRGHDRMNSIDRFSARLSRDTESCESESESEHNLDDNRSNPQSNPQSPCSPTSANSRISHLSQLSQVSSGTVRIHGHRRQQTSMALDLEGLHAPSPSPGAPEFESSPIPPVNGRHKRNHSRNRTGSMGGHKRTHSRNRTGSLGGHKRNHSRNRTGSMGGIGGHKRDRTGTMELEDAVKQISQGHKRGQTGSVNSLQNKTLGFLDLGALDEASDEDDNEMESVIINDVEPEEEDEVDDYNNEENQVEGNASSYDSSTNNHMRLLHDRVQENTGRRSSRVHQRGYSAPVRAKRQRTQTDTGHLCRAWNFEEEVSDDEDDRKSDSFSDGEADSGGEQGTLFNDISFGNQRVESYQCTYVAIHIPICSLLVSGIWKLLCVYNPSECEYVIT